MQVRAPQARILAEAGPEALVDAPVAQEDPDDVK
jgi:hypothetical protein